MWQADRPLAPRELAQVDMQRAGEEQEREHAVEERPVELDRCDRLAAEVPGIEAELAERHQRERERQRKEQQRNALRLADVLVVEPAEKRRQPDKGRRGIEKPHVDTDPRKCFLYRFLCPIWTITRRDQLRPSSSTSSLWLF